MKKRLKKKLYMKRRPSNIESKRLPREIKPEIRAKFQRALKEHPAIIIKALDEVRKTGPQAMP